MHSQRRMESLREVSFLAGSQRGLGKTNTKKSKGWHRRRNAVPFLVSSQIVCGSAGRSVPLGLEHSISKSRRFPFQSSFPVCLLRTEGDSPHAEDSSPVAGCSHECRKEEGTHTRCNGEAKGPACSALSFLHMAIFCSDSASLRGLGDTVEEA